jgi:hypothetical protein
MYYLVDIGDFLLIRMLIGLLTSLVSSRLTVLGFSTSVRLSVMKPLCLVPILVPLYSKRVRFRQSHLACKV